MAGKKAATSDGGAVPVMSSTRRRSSARKNKAFMMLQRDMEQVTWGLHTISDRNTSFYLFGQEKMRLIQSFLAKGGRLAQPHNHSIADLSTGL